MELKAALKEQYHAGIAMLAACIEKCPTDLWEGSSPCMDENRSIDRAFWRIAWHTLYFTHNYLVQTMEDFNASAGSWPEPIRSRLGVSESQSAVDVEPYELAAGSEPLSQAQMLDYLAYIDSLVDSMIDDLDLTRDETGFPWYPNMSKLSHELMSLRHIQGHVGQLSELLMARGIDTDWVAKAEPFKAEEPALQ